jgi:hypothetical protein
MMQEFGPLYLNRCHTEAEKERAIELMKKGSFPGCFSSWDCNWKNCPVRLAGQHRGYKQGGAKTLVLEAICDAELWMWYVFFGDCWRQIRRCKTLQITQNVGNEVLTSQALASTASSVVAHCFPLGIVIEERWKRNRLVEIQKPAPNGLETGGRSF